MIRELPLSPAPHLNRLNAALNQIFGAPVTIVARETPDHISTFRNEIITCGFGDGRRLRLLCKYGGAQRDITYGHRGGVPYESQIYARLLSAAPLTLPRYYGAIEDPGGATWLVIEYLDLCERVSDSPYPEAVFAAARWIGRFHAWSDAHPHAADSLLTIYDGAYFAGWAKRTISFTRHLGGRYPWLETVCRRFEELCPELLRRPLNAIHGEYYPKNILFRDGLIYPVDWETAAAAAGEIDLASLTEGWDAEIVEECERLYQLERWNGRPPDDFAFRMELARLYLYLRWLGDRPEWVDDEEYVWQFEKLQAIADRWGVVS